MYSLNIGFPLTLIALCTLFIAAVFFSFEKKGLSYVGSLFDEL